VCIYSFNQTFCFSVLSVVTVVAATIVVIVAACDVSQLLVSTMSVQLLFSCMYVLVGIVNTFVLNCSLHIINLKE